MDYRDNLLLPVLGLRIGEVGVVAVLQDWGDSLLCEWEYIEAAQKIKLHPTQFREVYSRIFYWSYCNQRANHYLISGVPGKQNLINVPSSVTNSVEPNAEHLAEALAHEWQVDLACVYKPGFVFSTLLNTATREPVVVTDSDTEFLAPFTKTPLWPFAKNVES